MNLIYYKHYRKKDHYKKQLGSDPNVILPEWWFPKKRICGFLSPDSRDTDTELFIGKALSEMVAFF